MAKCYCKCGAVFNKQSHIKEHVGICNPGWPRTSPNDLHVWITEAEFVKGMDQRKREAELGQGRDGNEGANRL